MKLLGWPLGLALLPVALVQAQSPAPAPAALASAAALRAPRISVEPANFDFGRVRQKRTVRREFTVRNFGNANLVIEKVSKTCGCTEADTESKVIKPGGRTPLRVGVDTRDDVGHVVRSVVIHSNDPAHPDLEVKIEATVVP